MYSRIIYVLALQALLTLHLLSAEVSPQSQQDVAAKIRDGIAAATRGEIQQAMIEYQSALRLDPDDGEANYRLGRLLGESGDFQSARRAFQLAIKSKPGFAEAHYDLGLTFVADTRGKVDWQSAIAEFRTALQLRSDYPDALNMLGVALVNIGDTGSAIKTFQQALKLSPDGPEIHFNLGSALETAEQPAAAETEYRAALNSKPIYPAAEVALGKLLAKDGKEAEAVQYLRSALRANPDLVSAHYVLATTLRSQGDARAAAIEFAQAKRLADRVGDAVRCSRLSNQGLELASKGDFSGAVSSLREAIELKPDYAVAHFNIGLLIADSGNLPAASKEIVKAISLQPAQPKFFFSLARVLERKGDIIGARDALERAARLTPSNAAILEKLHSLEHAGPQGSESDVPRGSLAISNERHLYRYGANANTASAHFAYGGELKRAGDVLGEIGELLRSLELKPDFMPARQALALDYLQVGKIDDSASEFHKMLDLSPDCAQAHFGLAKIALKQTDPATATLELRSALHLKPDYPEAAELLDRTMKLRNSKNN